MIVSTNIKRSLILICKPIAFSGEKNYNKKVISLYNKQLKDVKKNWNKKPKPQQTKKITPTIKTGKHPTECTFFPLSVSLALSLKAVNFHAKVHLAADFEFLAP